MTLFHLHIDGHIVSPETNLLAEKIGFEETPFRRDLMCDGFEAAHHFTYKTRDSRAFKENFDRAVDGVSDNGFLGYIEGEHIAYDCDILTNSSSEPVAISGRSIFRDLEDGEFRQSEIHISVKKNAAFKAVREQLRKLGFFSAFMDKPYGLAEILTIQGELAVLKELEKVVIDFLKRSNGLEHCSIKREDIARFWLSKPDVKRAPILCDIERLTITV